VVKRLKDIGFIEDEDEDEKPRKKRRHKADDDTDDDDDLPSREKAESPFSGEIVAPEYEESRLHSGQLEFLSIVRVLSDPDLQGRLWPRFNEDQFASAIARSIFTRVKTLQNLGKEFPSISTLAIDPALPKPSQAALSVFISSAENGRLQSDVDIGNGVRVPVSSSADFEGHVYDILEAYRITRQSMEKIVSVTNKLSDEGGFDPLNAPAWFERVAVEILALRGKEAIADALVHYGINTTRDEDIKRESEIDKIFATERLRFKTGFKAFDDKAGGFQPGEVVLMGANSGGGKCQPGWVTTLSSAGVLSFDELASDFTAQTGYTNVVSTIHGENGKEEATQFYAEDVAETVEFMTSLGFQNEGTLKHRVRVVNNQGIQWRHHSDITVGEAVVLMHGQDMWGSTTDVPMNDNFRKEGLPSALTPELARVLGYLVSEGRFNKPASTTGFSFTNTDPDVWVDWNACSNACGMKEQRPDGTSIHLPTRPSYISYFEKLGFNKGLSGDRAIPVAIRRAPKEVVVNFLRALFEGDGFIQNDNKKQVLYATTSPTLAFQLRVVLANLGIVTNTVVQKKSATNGIPGNASISHTLIIGHRFVDTFAKEIGFLSSRKKLELENCLKRGTSGSVDRKTERLYGVSLTLTSLYNRIREGLRSQGIPLQKAVGGQRDHNVLRGCVRTQRFTKNNARLLVLQAEALGISGRDVDFARFLGREDIVIDVITDVQHNHKPIRVYDYVVPGTNSFCANGFIQHNTAMALSTMVNMAKMGTSVAMLQLELTNSQVNERLSANLANLDADAIRTGKLTEKQKRLVKDSHDEFHEDLKAARSRFTIFAPSSATIQECEYIFKSFPYRVWFIDYINLLKWDNGKQGDTRSGEDWTRLSDIVKEFKRIAKKYGICVVLLVQINVEKESGDMSIRYAKAMLEHADIVQVWNLTADAKKDGMVWIRHLKARQYEMFDYAVRVALDKGRFESIDMTLLPKPEEKKLGSKKKVRDNDDADAPSPFKKKEKPLPVPAEETKIPDNFSSAETVAAFNNKPRLVVVDNYAEMDE